MKLKTYFSVSLIALALTNIIVAKDSFTNSKIVFNNPTLLQKVSFQAYMAKFGKSYTSTSEFELRQSNWIATDEFIKATTDEQVVLAHNQFSDWSPEERENILNKQLAKKPARGDDLFVFNRENLTSAQNTPFQVEFSSKDMIFDRSLSACQAGQFQGPISNPGCFNCSQGCGFCETDALCNICLPGFFSDGLGGCYPCSPGCLSCTSSFTCTSCNPKGFYLNSTTGSCGACGIGCQQCTNEGFCVSCLNSNFTLTSGSCQCQNGPLLPSLTNCGRCAIGEGYFTSDRSCKTCEVKFCGNCNNNASNCLSCFNGWKALNGQCKCPSGNITTDGNKCWTCFERQYFTGTNCSYCPDKNCQDCQSSKIGLCSICKPGFTLNKTSNVCGCRSDQIYNKTLNVCINKVVCKDGFYDPGNNTCAACGNFCIKCSERTGYCKTCQDSSFQIVDANANVSCLTCSAPFQSVEFGQCRCPSNTFLNGTVCSQNFTNCAKTAGSNFYNNGKNVCLKCPTKYAATCADYSGNTITCSSTFSLKDNICVCTKNQFLSTLTSQCVDFINCGSSKFNLGNNSCAQCPQYCSNCSDFTGQCTSCVDTSFDLNNQQNICSCVGSTYLTNSSTPKNAKCAQCGPFCVSCLNFSGACVKCANTFTLNQTVGSCQCDPLKTFFDSANRVCVSLIDCGQGRYNDGKNNCIDLPPVQQPCPKYCQNCTINGQCTQCYPTFDLDVKNNKCSCSQGNFLTLSSSNQYGCQKCKDNCTQCADLTGKCTSCLVTFTLLNDQTCQCQPSQIYDKSPPACIDLINCGLYNYNPGNNICKNCPAWCPICDKNGVCQQCDDNTVYSNTTNQCNCAGLTYLSPKGNPLVGSCKKCGDNCLKCDNTNGQCQFCASKFFLQNFECKDCPDAYCTNCNNLTGASTTCLDTFLLDEIQGVCVCPAGNYISKNQNGAHQCLKCPGSHVSTCDNQGMTLTCNNTFVLMNPDGFWSNQGKFYYDQNYDQTTVGDIDIALNQISQDGYLIPQLYKAGGQCACHTYSRWEEDNQIFRAQFYAIDRDICQDCSDAHATTCISGQSLSCLEDRNLVGGKCQCRDGFYSVTGKRDCQECSGTFVATCSSEIGTTLTCDNTFNLSSDGINCECSQGSYLNTIFSQSDPTYLTCVVCPGVHTESCQINEGRLELQCKETFSLFSDNASGEESCNCYDGQYLNEQGYCKDCNDIYAATCDSNGTTLTCIDQNMVVVQGKCSCQTAQYLYDGYLTNSYPDIYYLLGGMYLDSVQSYSDVQNQFSQVQNFDQVQTVDIYRKTAQLYGAEYIHYLFGDSDFVEDDYQMSSRLQDTITSFTNDFLINSAITDYYSVNGLYNSRLEKIECQACQDPFASKCLYDIRGQYYGLECKDTFYMGENICYCPKGNYILNTTCVPCLSTNTEICDKFGQTTLCNSTFTLLSDNTCGCLENENLVGTGKNQRCLLCPDLYAKDCDDNKFSTLCSDSSFLIINGKCTCPQGQYPDNNNDNKIYKCIPCSDPEALSCDENGNTNVCKPTWNLNLRTLICECSPQNKGYFNDTSSGQDTCKKCLDPNAIMCDFSTGITIQNGCAQSFTLKSNGKCGCSDTYQYLDFDSNKCAPCPYPYANTCISDYTKLGKGGQTTSCDWGLVISNGSCVCPTLTFLMMVPGTQNLQCIQCKDQNATECQMAGGATTKCVTNFTLNTATGLCLCNPGRYFVQKDIQNPLSTSQCIQCADPNAATCNQDQSLTCKSSFTLQNGTCSCSQKQIPKQAQFFDSQTKSCKFCADPFAIVCQNGTTSVCAGDMQISNLTGKCACNSTSLWPNPKANYFCDLCLDQNALTCNQNTGLGATCPSGLTLNSGGLCSCRSGSYIISKLNANSTSPTLSCVICPGTNVQTCADFTGLAVNCKYTTMTPSGNNCACNSSQYFNTGNNTCVSIPQNCTVAQSNGSCSACQSSFQLTNQPLNGIPFNICQCNSTNNLLVSVTANASQINLTYGFVCQAPIICVSPQINNGQNVCVDSSRRLSVFDDQADKEEVESKDKNKKCGVGCAQCSEDSTCILCDKGLYADPNNLKYCVACPYSLQADGKQQICLTEKASDDRIVPKFNLTDQQVDWRNWNVVRAVKNQGKCGGDFAFSTAAAAESAYAIKTGQILLLSDQYVIDCDSGSLGCQGGWQESAAILLSTEGAVLEKDYPFTGKQSGCLSNQVQKVFKLEFPGIAKVDSNKNAFKVALTISPLSVSLRVQSDKFFFYSQGVLPGDFCASGDINHAMLAVGYGKTSDGVEYAVIQNQWGSTWGEDGFLRVELTNDEEGTCGLYQKANKALV